MHAIMLQLISEIVPEGYAECPLCGTHVHLGTASAGIKNLDKRHLNSKICRKAKEKRDKAPKKNMSIFGFMNKIASPVPPTVPAPPLVHATSKPSTTSAATNITTTSTQPPDKSCSCPIARKLLQELRAGIDQLPTTIRDGEATDVFAELSGDPSSYADPGATLEEVWEQMLHPLLTKSLGWKTTVVEAEELVCRGELGLEGF